MPFKIPATVWMAGLAAAALVAFGVSRYEAGKREALWRAQVDSLSHVADVLKTDLEMHFVVDSAREAAISFHDSIAAEHAASADRWRTEARATKATLGGLLAALPDTVGERVNSIIDNMEAQHEQESLALRNVIFQKDSMLAIRERQVIEKNVLIVRQASLIDGLQRQLARSGPKRSFLASTGEKLLYVGAGALACAVLC